MPVPKPTEHHPKAAAQFDAALSVLFTLRGILSFTRSYKSAEVVAEVVQKRITTVGGMTASVESGPTWKNGRRKSFNARCHNKFTLQPAPIR